MAISRYRRQILISNDFGAYKEILNNRGVKTIHHFSFQKFKELKVGDLPGILLETHTWERSDRFYKLASHYYGDSQYWWVIAFFNNTPLETDVKLGQKIIIPTPLDVIISALEV
tara:strand:+ start:1065 stop:1406 length:342 start_codon:yes stop_codon:yes gene_type:complete